MSTSDGARGWITLVAVAALVAVGGAVQLTQILNHDVGWLLVATRRLADGASLYADDVVETNPPLILYLYLPPVMLARWLALPEIALFRAYVILWISGSLWLCASLLRAVLDANDAGSRRAVLVALALAWSIPFHSNFGQREHFVAIAVAPYLIAAAGRMRGAALPHSVWAAGILAGIAFSIKPHLAIAAMAIESAVALRRGSMRAWLRPEALVAAAVVVVYALSVVTCFPGYFELMVPLMRDTYGVAFQRPRVALVKPRDLVLLVAGGLAIFALRRTHGPRALATAFGLGGAGFYLAHVVQGIGWRYHLIPFQCCALVLILLAATRWLRRDQPRRGRALAAAATLFLLLAGSWAVSSDVWSALRGQAAWRSAGSEGALAAFRRVVDEHAPGGSILFFSSGLRWAFPLVNHAELEWTSRFPSLWLVPSILSLRASGDPDAADHADRIESYVRNAIAEDLERRPPDLVFVDVSPRKPFLRDVAFEFIPWLSRDPRFARLWSGYERVRRAGTYEVFRRRKHAGADTPRRR